MCVYMAVANNLHHGSCTADVCIVTYTSGIPQNCTGNIVAYAYILPYLPAQTLLQLLWVDITRPAVASLRD